MDTNTPRYFFPYIGGASSRPVNGAFHLVFNVIAMLCLAQVEMIKYLNFIGLQVFFNCLLFSGCAIGLLEERKFTCEVKRS